MITESIITYRLRECLLSCLDLSKQNGLEIVHNALKGVMDNLESPMQLAIIGKVSSSKSTLVNAILGKEDVVGTGQMEETFNVSWLKYGSTDNDVKVVFKDGSSKYIPRNEWKNWSGQSANILKEKVKYLEVTYEHDILKNINIIDTPGLDSAKGTDSRNTIDFLTNVRPDAVIMVFTRGLAQNTLDVVKEFQGNTVNSFSLSPLNAMGLLSKADTLWRISDAERLPYDIAKNEIIDGNIYKLFPEIKGTLFAISPVCALLGLASSSLSQHDVGLLVVLSRTSDSVLNEMLHSVNDFYDDYFQTEISIDERKYLHLKFGLYGIYEAVKLCRQGRLNEENLKMVYREVSGFEEFERCLYSHFGQRRILIKTQSASQIITSACNKQRSTTTNDSALRKIDAIEDKFLNCIMNIFEYKQLSFLTKIYGDNMNINDSKALEEYKRVCGEYGDSVIRKLGLEGTPMPEDMVKIAEQRHSKWNVEYQLAYHKAKNLADLYHMLASSYDMLSKDISEVSKQADGANKILTMANSFFYGK